MPVKIAFLTTQFSEVKSGPGRFTEYLRQLHEPSLEFHFFSDQISQDSGRERAVPVPSWMKKLPLSWLVRSFSFAFSVRKAHKKQSFDWVLASDYAVGWALAISGCPTRLAIMVNDDNFLLIYRPGEHQSGMSTGKRWARRLGYFFERAAVKNADLVVSNSLYTKSLLEEIYQVELGRSRLLYKAVDLSFFQWKDRPVTPPRKFLFVKNDWRRGGLDLILQAFADLSHQKEIQFTIAGISPSEMDQVSELVKGSGFRGEVMVEGLIKRNELKERMDWADVFISMSRQEALGVSCLEAMAAGLPVIATDAGGLKEVLDQGEAGFMIPREDVETLSRVLNKLESDPSALTEKAIHARQHVLKFSVEKLKENLQNLFLPNSSSNF